MGILNVTPDSFSDGGKYNTVELAVDRAAQMIKEGADIVDVGGESTKPGSERVSLEEELNRIIPVIMGIRQRFNIPISVDTYKSVVAEEALRNGASIINDISGFERDKQMIDVALKYQATSILTHMKGDDPKFMQENPVYTDVVSEVFNSLIVRATRFRALGLENVLLDPGFGFGKTLEDNYQLLKELPRLKDAGFPILVGISRKSMIGKVVESLPNERIAGTITLHTIAILNGASIIRVHDVKEAYQSVRVIEKYFSVA